MEPSTESPSPEATTEFEVYGYDLPKLSEDGKSALPVKPASVDRFPSQGAAEARLKEIGSKFERVQLLAVTKTGDKVEPKLLKRFVDGKEERAEDIVRR